MIFKLSSVLTALAFLFVTALPAQGMIDGFFAPKGKASLTGSFSSSTFDAFYVGDMKVDGVPAHGKISQQIYSLYGTYGITNNLTVIINAPYISAKGEGAADPVNGSTEQSGFQDLGLAVKYRPFSTTFDGGQFDGLVSIGVGIAGGYEPNGILSIGSGAFATNIKVGGQLMLESGIFTSLMAGYSARGTADNNLEGNSGGRKFDVPNAVTGVARVGYAGAKIYVDAWLDFQSSTNSSENFPNGLDIMGEGFTGNFPETDVNYSRIGATVYVPVTPALGLSLGYGTVINGRNLGDSNTISGGITYSFGGTK